MISNSGNGNLPRRKFLPLFGIFTAISVSGFSFFAKRKPKMVKMLTQDGKLVEVDESMIQKKRRVSDKELANWISDKKLNSK